MLNTQRARITKRQEEILEYILEPIRHYPYPERSLEEPPATEAIQADARDALIEVSIRIQKSVAELEKYHRIIQATTPTRFGQPRLFQPGSNAYKYRYYMYDLYKALQKKDWHWACRRLQQVVELYRNCALQSAITIHKMLEDTLCTSNSTKKR